MNRFAPITASYAPAPVAVSGRDHDEDRQPYVSRDGRDGVSQKRRDA